jgi:hypothetical protein
MLELRYAHPQTGEPISIRQAVRIARDQSFTLEAVRDRDAPRFFDI